MAMRTLMSQEVKVKSYRIHLLEMVINAIYYNPVRSPYLISKKIHPADFNAQVLALHVLESKEWTNKFFSWWFSSIDSFSRVHDKKLSISAIVSLLTLNADQVPVSVQQGWPRLLQVCIAGIYFLSPKPHMSIGHCSAIPNTPRSFKE